MQDTKYEMVSDFDLTDLDVTKPDGESQDDITIDPRVTPKMLENFFKNREAEGILRKIA